MTSIKNKKTGRSLRINKILFFRFLLPLPLSLLIVFILILLVPGLCLSQKEQKSVWKKYDEATYLSLDCMRSLSGLVHDLAYVLSSSSESCPLALQKVGTSPTNIALDLLIQHERSQEKEGGPRSVHASQVIKKILKTLELIPRHNPSGLYFNRYSEEQNPQARDYYLSSVDNIHLLLALWTLAETGADFEIRKTSKRIYEQMDYSIFYNPQNGLVRGGYSYDSQAKKWIAAQWYFSHAGSEARGIYSLGWALNLFRDPQFLTKFFKNIKAEIFWLNVEGENLPLFSLWDGGGFQLLLPEVLIKESQYSPLMKKMFESYSKFVLAESRRRNLPVPAAHSASLFGVEKGPFHSCGEVPCYNGKAGSVDLVTRMNQEPQEQPAMRRLWEAVFTPHAGFMAALFQPGLYAGAFIRAEQIRVDNQNFFDARFGWLDGYFVSPPYQGTLVSGLLSLDQGMVGLSSQRILSVDNHTSSSRALASKSAVVQRMKEFYRLFDEYLVAGGKWEGPSVVLSF